MPSGTRPAAPSLVVDISSVYDIRKRAIESYPTQFFRQHAGDPQTRISHPDFLASLEGTCRYLGALIGVAYGEGFTSATPVAVADIVSQYSKEPWKLPPDDTST